MLPDILTSRTVNNMVASNGNIKGFNAQTKRGAKRPIDDEKAGSVSAKKPKLSERTDYSRWRLLNEAGRQTWHYLKDDEEVKEWPQSTADKYFLGLPLVR